MSEGEDGRFAFDGLDRAIHEKARLGVMTSLIGHPKGLAFVDLKKLCGLTDGNLNRHLQVLQESSLIKVTKETSGGRPVTTCRLTDLGRTKFVEYLDVLEAIVREARQQDVAPTPRLARV